MGGAALDRRDDATVDAVAVVVTVTLLLLTGLGMRGPLRTVLALAFVTFVPGWAFLDHVRLAEGASRIALAVALSLTICTGVSVVALWLHLWDPLILVDCVGGLSLIALVWNLASPDHERRRLRRSRGRT